jgi:AcrR family transcriptional regulator
MSKIITTPERDGRHQRTERSRTALINAALALINEGVLVATAQQIANRAEVGIRTFFRHFDDKSALAEAVNLSIRDNYEVIAFGSDRSGTIEQRIQRAVEHRVDVYVYEQKLQCYSVNARPALALRYCEKKPCPQSTWIA